MSKIHFDQYIDFINNAIEYIESHDNLITPDKKKEIEHLKGKYLGTFYEDYQPVNETPAFNDFYWLFLRTVHIAIYVTIEKTFYKELFNAKNVITPWDFLNFSYMAKLFTTVFNEPYIQLQSLSHEASNDVSIQSFINAIKSEPAPWMEQISEYEFYDILTRLNNKEASILLGYVECKLTIKSQLKKLLLERNEADFCSLCIEDGVNYSLSAGLSSLWYSLFITIKSAVKETVTLSEDVAPSYSSIDNALENIMTSALYVNDTTNDVFIACHNMLGNGDMEYLTENYINLFKAVSKAEGSLILFYVILKSISKNTQALAKLDNLIVETPYYRELLNDLTFDNYLTYNYRLYSPIDDFQEYFVEERQLPSAIKEHKNAGEYIDSSRGTDVDAVIYIYKILVEANVLDSTDESFYSFVYRLSAKYKGELEPSKIIWKWSPRDLYYFVFWFSNDNDSRLWSKTAKFFIFNDGSSPKTNGVKNQAAIPTNRMKELIDRLSPK